MQAENYSKGVLLAMVVNVVTTVGVVMVNKYIAAELRFNFMIFLSAIHFCFTGLFAYIAMKLGYFQYKSATVKQVLPLAFGSAFSVGFNNLSLGYNSVGTYQMAKLVCIPCTAWVQYKMLGVKLSQKEVTSLAILLFGVGIATVTDLELNFWGSVYAACAILCTVAGQVLTKQYQKSLGLDAMQLLLHVCPLMTAILFVSSPILETMRGYSPLGLLDYYAFMQNEVDIFWLVTCVFVTCLFAFGINSSNYIVIGQTSPITYQVVGHSKTIMILTLGTIFFNKVVAPVNAIGIMIAMGGVVWYSMIKQALAASAEQSLPTSSTEKGDQAEMQSLARK